MKPFKCERCGYCCTLRVKLTLPEYIRLRLLGYKNFTERDTKNRRCIKLIKNKCCFLTKRNKKSFCKIYKYRPKMCRRYPGYKEGLCREINPAVREFQGL